MDIIQYVTEHKDQLSEIALGAILLSRMVAALTPSKRDDEIASGLARFARKTVEVVSGAGHRNLVTEAKPAITTPTPDDDGDPFEALAQVVDKFEGKIIIVPKEKKNG